MKIVWTTSAALALVGCVLASCSSSSGGGGGPSAGDAGDAGNQDATAGCGAAGEACCGGTACNNGLTCQAGSCSAPEVDEAGASDAGLDAPGLDATSDGSTSDASGPDATSDGAGVDAAGDASNDPCKGGHYQGSLAGNYNTKVTSTGVPLPVAATIDFTLQSEGSAGTTCMLAGRTRPCSDLFTLQAGSIVGTLDVLFPLFCTLTGAFDCESKELVGAWAQCAECVGPLADGGMGCNGGIPSENSAGPVAASYDASTGSFVMGTWLVAESLAGNDGGAQGPDGGPPSSYLPDGGFVGKQYGANGTWTATLK
jgi:hypothetical protein